MYEVRGWMKFAEEDEYKEGCLPETARCYDDHNTLFVGHTANELIHKLMDFVDAEADEVMLDSCGTKGRIDIQVLETGDGYRARHSDIERWKKGTQKLWACVYTFYAFEVARVAADLSGASDYFEREA